MFVHIKCPLFFRHLQRDLAAPMTHITLMSTMHKNTAVSLPWTAADVAVVTTGVGAVEAAAEVDLEAAVAAGNVERNFIKIPCHRNKPINLVRLNCLGNIEYHCISCCC